MQTFLINWLPASSFFPCPLSIIFLQKYSPLKVMVKMKANLTLMVFRGFSCENMSYLCDSFGWRQSLLIFKICLKFKIICILILQHRKLISLHTVDVIPWYLLLMKVIWYKLNKDHEIKTVKWLYLTAWVSNIHVCYLRL